MIPDRPKFAYELGPNEMLGNRGSHDDILASKNVSILLPDNTEQRATVFFRTSPANLRKLQADPTLNVQSNRETVAKFKEMLRDKGQSALVVERAMVKINTASLKNAREEKKYSLAPRRGNPAPDSKPLLERTQSLRMLAKRGEVAARKLEETGKAIFGDVPIPAETFESLLRNAIADNRLPTVDSTNKVYHHAAALKASTRAPAAPQPAKAKVSKPLPNTPQKAGKTKPLPNTPLKAGQGKPLPQPPAKTKPASADMPVKPSAPTTDPSAS